MRNCLSNLSDEEDDEAELLRELEKIKKERAEQREREVCRLHWRYMFPWTDKDFQEREKAAEEQDRREKDIALGNPLLNGGKDFNVRRR